MTWRPDTTGLVRSPAGYWQNLIAPAVPFDYSRLCFHQSAQQRLKPVSPYDVMALDTETCEGYARVICDSKGRHVEVESLVDALEFILRTDNFHHHIFCYNQRFDAESILKWATPETIAELVTEGAATEGEYRLKYLPGKKLTISRQKHCVSLYDVAQYFQGAGVNGGSSLDAVAEKYLGERKIGEDLDKNRMNTDWAYFQRNMREIIKYCSQDALLTKKIADILDTTVKEVLHVPPKSYVSKASLSKQYFRTTADFPMARDNPLHANVFAHKAYSGGRFECTTTGQIKGCTLIDICSAYPYQIAQLPDTRRGVWKITREHHPDADLGFYWVEVEVDPFTQIAPLPFRLKNGKIIYPTGHFQTYCTHQELRAYQKHCRISVIAGWEWFANDLVYPFREGIEHLYELKGRTPKDDFRYSLSKILMNSLYGSFYEKYTSRGRLISGVVFNPVYACLITAGTRVQLYQTVQPIKHLTRAFATDSIAIEGAYTGKTGKGLGDWDVDCCGDMTVAKSGVYEMGGKTKTRGMQRGQRLRTAEGEFDNLFDYMRAYPDQIGYATLENRPRHMSECVLHYKALSVDDINVWTESSKTYKLADSKRVWACDHEITGRDILETAITSVPWHIERNRIGSPYHLDEWDTQSAAL